MTKKLFSIFIAFIMLQTNAVASDLAETFDTFWEMQWHQSGYPLNVRKFNLATEKKLIYSISPTASKASEDYIQEAIALIANESGIEFIQAIDHHAGVQIKFEVKRFSDEELRQAICSMRSTEKSFQITHATLFVSEQHAYRCVLHELMHAMGFMGHPMGDTVLTYFGGVRSKLSEIDKFVLRYWYGDSKNVLSGMNIFRVTRDLQLRWIDVQVPESERLQAREQQKIWFAQTMAQMDAFADGKGEPPRILYRSGRLNEAGLTYSRNVIQGILGVAYLEGYGVEKNSARAYVLLFRGAQALQLGAVNALERGLVGDKFVGVDAKPACAWLRDRLIQNNRADLIKSNQARMSKSCGNAFVVP